MDGPGFMLARDAPLGRHSNAERTVALALGSVGEVDGHIGTGPFHTRRGGVPDWQKLLFASLRTASSAPEFSHLPPNRVIGPGRQVTR